MTGTVYFYSCCSYFFSFVNIEHFLYDLLVMILLLLDKIIRLLRSTNHNKPTILYCAEMCGRDFQQVYTIWEDAAKINWLSAA